MGGKGKWPGPHIASRMSSFLLQGYPKVILLKQYKGIDPESESAPLLKCSPGCAGAFHVDLTTLNPRLLYGRRGLEWSRVPPCAQSTSIHVREPSTNLLYGRDQLFKNTDENDPTAENNNNNLQCSPGCAGAFHVDLTTLNPRLLYGRRGLERSRVPPCAQSTSIHVREPSTNLLYGRDQLFKNTDENNPTAANNSNNLPWHQQRGSNKLCVHVVGLLLNSSTPIYTESTYI